MHACGWPRVCAVAKIRTLLLNLQHLLNSLKPYAAREEIIAAVSAQLQSKQALIDELRSGAAESAGCGVDEVDEVQDVPPADAAPALSASSSGQAAADEEGATAAEAAEAAEQLAVAAKAREELEQLAKAMDAPSMDAPSMDMPARKARKR